MWKSTKRAFTVFFVFLFFLTGVIHAKNIDEDARQFLPWGTGMSTSVELNDPHCGYLPQGCQAKFRGIWQLGFINHGKFSAQIASAWQNSTINGISTANPNAISIQS